MTQTVVIRGDAQRVRAHQLVDRAPVGFVITFKEPTRTNEQNSRMWAMLSEIAAAKPDGRQHSAEVWKCIFMQALGHEVAFVQCLDSQSVFPLGMSSSKLTVSQMGDLMEFIEEFCARKDIQLMGEPNPAGVLPQTR